jgi:hypothetical protein
MARRVIDFDVRQTARKMPPSVNTQPFRSVEPMKHLGALWMCRRRISASAIHSSLGPAVAADREHAAGP